MTNLILLPQSGAQYQRWCRTTIAIRRPFRYFEVGALAAMPIYGVELGGGVIGLHDAMLRMAVRGLDAETLQHQNKSPAKAGLSKGVEYAVKAKVKILAEYSQRQKLAWF